MARIIEHYQTYKIYTPCEHFKSPDSALSDPEREKQLNLSMTGYYLQYCPVCGQKLQKEIQSPFKACGNCHIEIDKITSLENIYCIHCGEKFED